jgi:hypothetical protein
MDELLQPGHALRIMRLARPLDEDGLHCMNFIQAARHCIFCDFALPLDVVTTAALSALHVFPIFRGPLWGPIG